MNRTSLLFAPAGLLALNAGLVQVHAAAVDYFLKLDGIEGESTEANHKGWIQLDSFTFGVSNPTTVGSAAGGAGAGKVKFSDIVVTKHTDSSSPTLIARCANGNHIQGAVLEVVSHDLKLDYKGQAAPVILRLTLTDTQIDSVQENGSGSTQVPQESMSLNFTQVDVSDPSAPKSTNPVDSGTIGTISDDSN